MSEDSPSCAEPPEEVPFCEAAPSRAGALSRSLLSPSSADEALLLSAAAEADELEAFSALSAVATVAAL
ncbi:hypothetical protein [Ruminococcus sp.]|uniref:hypothetical protein n=1 Tax=Ruminococcus sp. TaxID=41978 RepID=UPI0038672C94